MEITPELLKTRTQKNINKQVALLAELFKSQEFTDICTKHNATLVDISSACINEIFATTNIELQNTKVFEMLDSFLEAVAKEINVHPSDATLLIAKLFSDIMVQITALAELRKENNIEDESEEK